MKTFLKFTVVAFLATLGLCYLTKWSFWTIFIVIELGYAAHALHATHPRSTKWAIGLIVAVIFGSWAWTWLGGNLPLSRQTLPYAKNWQDARLARAMDPGLSKASSALLMELQKKEDALAASIPGLMQAGKYGEVKTNAQELINLRQEIDKLLVQMAPPPTTTAIQSKAAAPPSIPGITLEIALTNDQVLVVKDDMRQGQSWRYLSFAGAFSHRIDKGDGQASWKLVNNNLPWQADYAGLLQIKAGNTPVKLTVNIAP